MFRTLSLAKKLTLGGFGLVLVLLVGVGMIALSALETAKDGFVEYREMLEMPICQGEFRPIC